MMRMIRMTITGQPESPWHHRTLAKQTLWRSMPLGRKKKNSSPAMNYISVISKPDVWFYTVPNQLEDHSRETTQIPSVKTGSISPLAEEISTSQECCFTGKIFENVSFCLSKRVPVVCSSQSQIWRSPEYVCFVVKITHTSLRSWLDRDLR